jgi:hypothetical protein
MDKEQFRKWLETKVSDILFSRYIPRRLPGETTDRYATRRANANISATSECVGRIVKLLGLYPEGMDALINIPNRVHGFFWQARDAFFYVGSPADLTGFLINYSKISAIKKHLLFLHDGIGEAKSPWETIGRPCDWELYGCPEAWLDYEKILTEGTHSTALQKAGRETNYVLEVHFWTGGHIPWKQVAVPPNVEVRRQKRSKRPFA